jgi:phosphatidyl-myo-inositol alpha-mannosyltransferase
MKIAMAHLDLPNESKGGVAFQAHYLANTLANRGHDLTMFTCSPPYEDCSYNVYQYPISSHLRQVKPFIFAAYLAKTDFSEFDVLHTHGDNYLVWGYHPQVRTFHGSAKDEARSAVRLRRRIYQTVMIGLEQVGAWIADRNVGVSQATQLQIPAVSDIIPCGVDIAHFYPGQKVNHPCILFVGTISGRKRGAMLTDIFKNEIRPRFPHAELWMVAEQNVDGEGIINFGKVSLEKLCELYKRAWVFCLPSTYEGFGVPYIEAMASGTTVLASPNPGALEVLDQGKYGMVVNDDELANQLVCLLENDHARQSYVEKGLARVKEYAWSQVADQYEKLYNELLRDR